MHTTLATRQMKTLLVATLAASFLLAPIMCFAATDNKNKPWPKRDFLPPIANINPKLDASQEAMKEVDRQVEEVNFFGVDTQAAVRLRPKPEKLVGGIAGQGKTEQMQTVQDIQKKVNEADLEYLWQATVEKNPVIRFSLEKLATPADLETKQSSKFLTKTLSTLISGATLASTVMMPGGANMYNNMGSMAVGQALRNMVDGRVKPTVGSLSATEQIQLAGLIDDLKGKLIHSYQDYKSTLEHLAQCHETTLKNNAAYSKALASKDDMAMMLAGTTYYQSLSNETALRQKAKLYRLELERLAGPDAVSRLELAAHVNTMTQTVMNTAPIKMLTKSVDTDALNSNVEDLPYTVPEPIGPQPLIGPEPTKIKKSALPALPAPMELLPSFKTDAHLPSPMPEQATSVHRKAIAEGQPKTPGGLEPIEVLHP